MRFGIVFVLLAATAAGQTGLRAGVARADITPPAGVMQWGYSNRASAATGTRDPLYARALALDDGMTVVALVQLDLGRTFSAASMNAVRRQVAPLGVRDVIFSATHTHSGPVIDDEHLEGRPPAWEQTALDRIGQTIRAAYTRRAEARLGAGWGVAYIGHDRRYVRLDGSVHMQWRNATGVYTYPVDPIVGVLRVDDAGGRPIAVLVNYACHPVVFGPDNLRYSADYPGVVAEWVDRETGGMTFFLQGAPGDINPYMDKTPLQEDAEGELQRAGERLGREVVRVARGITTRPAAGLRIGLRVDTMRFALRWNPDAMRALIDRAVPEPQRARYRSWIQPHHDLPVTTLTIGDDLAFVGMPGEPFVGFQMDLRARAPAPYTYFLGYTNGYFGYFPGIREAAAGGYGANGLVTRVEVGAGERMLDRGIINLYRLLGKLSDRPER
jgi:hypothetical protein